MLRPALAVSFLALALGSTSRVGSVAAAQSLDDLYGTWVWELEGHNLIVLKLQADSQGLSGTLQRPTRMTFAVAPAGVSVSGIQMPVQTKPVQSARQVADGQLLRTTGADGNEEQFVIRADGKGALSLRVDPNPAAPTLVLRRPRDPATVATDWDPELTYQNRSTKVPASAELTAIFDADQADRKDGPKTDWEVVGPRDKSRRLRVRQMLDADELHSADDYYHAAFIFQHGDGTDDYLLAHVLAMAAQAQGHSQAGWIAMATLDRYLQKIGRAQVLGTQYVNEPGGTVTRGLHDDALVPDSLRLALGVPTRAQEQAQRAVMETGK